MADNKFWYKDAVFYELYVRAFKDSNGDGQGDLRGVIQKLDYLKELGVDCIWLLPIFPSPRKDDGYDISDYNGILSDFGNLKDFKELINSVHSRGMHILIDLVINHTSDEHPWFQQARQNKDSKYRNYYVWSDTINRYSEARIIFVDSEESNWTWDPIAEQYYWHRFYSSQPDLNYDNPDVRAEIINVMQYWLDMGVDGFRVDAVPYLFEREGTNCENLPETHAFLKEMRRFVDEKFPGRLLLCEANQSPEDVREYFGDGDEFQMGFHFPLMPRIFMSLKRGNSHAIKETLDRTPVIPDECQWCIFLRNHDELTLEMVTEKERQWMWEHYAPDESMRLNLGIRRRLAPLLDNDQQKIELANSLLFTLPGSPAIYYGDEIGMGDNIGLKDRDGLRTPMQWEPELTAGFSEASPENYFSPISADPEYRPDQVNVSSQRKDEQSLFNFIRHMIEVRKSHHEMGLGDFQWIDCDHPSIAAYLRTLRNHNLLVVHNLSSTPCLINLSLEIVRPTVAKDLLTGKKFLFPKNHGLNLHLKPLQYFWFEMKPR
jgi:maltose alpha-D-glucosyltransferase/alpha-amylase